MNDIEFLSRLYELEKLPSTDGRYKDAAGDIWQHRYNNDDWESGWIYNDSRFQLVDGGAEVFLRFLCEMVHPLVRPDREEALKLVNQFNDQLKGAGWELFQEELIAGRPRLYFPICGEQRFQVSTARQGRSGRVECGMDGQTDRTGRTGSRL
jgi:hypothetical protein